MHFLFLSDSPFEAILSYRWALLHSWNLDAETTARIQKQFAIFLLHSGGEASPPNLLSQMGSSFVPGNNIEEAVLLLMILLRKVSLKRIEWDPSILDHLSFALSISGDFKALIKQIKELLPGFINHKERYLTRIHNFVPALLMASRICGEKPNLAEEGINFACRALESLENGCKELEGTANLLLGVACSTRSKSVLSDVERVTRQSKALQALESARKISTQKCFVDGEIVVNAALDQTGKWDQGELLHTKAKLQTAQGELKSAVETYSQLLALLQDLRYPSASFEQEIWHDLAHLYISLSQWRDAEICLSKSKAIDSYSADRIHVTGVLYERKCLLKEALEAFQAALDIDPDHVPSMISTACLLRRVSSQCNAVAKSLPMNALRVDRMNPSAWYNLGLLHKAEEEEGVSSMEEAVECWKFYIIHK
ncbi:hypothetical protein F3Y22_tig00111105pilonHSYRG00033 [Hibiscus syriacus]|uniref:Uncharacterized protein n=1 Tax=Hibiscus syriacus TaxID=106335 RepID=A0A6A2YYR6_HIBSY|nr:hypothetical protein F3Y22_tig00111105pilonHSYRG00033 [Hibiscus syriacus]